MLIDEVFATAAISVPIASNWVEAPTDINVALVPGVTAAQVGPDDIALISSAEVLWLQESHEVVGDVAVVADADGAVAMRTPVRPDEVESTPVRLVDASATAELLARATLAPFYGIAATAWLRGNQQAAAEAEVVIVEGAEALREQEAGFSENLVRAWYILTEQSFVSHLLIAPRSVPAEVLLRSVAFLDAARATSLERRREWRAPLADREGVGRDRAYSYWAAQRLTLEEGDRRALLDLLGRGTRGSPYPAPTHNLFRDRASRD